MPKRICGLFDKNGKTHQAGSIWDKDKISPTLDTCGGGIESLWFLKNPLPMMNKTNIYGEME